MAQVIVHIADYQPIKRILIASTELAKAADELLNANDEGSITDEIVDLRLALDAYLTTALDHHTPPDDPHTPGHAHGQGRGQSSRHDPTTLPQSTFFSPR